MAKPDSIQTISVLVPANPFHRVELQGISHCLAALDVEKLIEWWPGKPHSPHRDPSKVLAVQRSLDWKRVAHIAAYLLQNEITEAPDRIDTYFREIYAPLAKEPGREWPPKVPQVIGFAASEYPTFSNILLHVNGATVTKLPDGAAQLKFDERDPNLNFSVIDGQHRINGAFLAVKILSETRKHVKWEIPAEIFIDLDQRKTPPRRQAQIFIDVNFYQKKVDRSLVADLFPTARGERTSLTNIERAQDLGRKLMLETGPLVGMIQIPGIKYGVKDVVTLSTLNGAIEDALPVLFQSDIATLDEQATFISMVLSSWLVATGRMERPKKNETLDPENVVYQGRVLVSVLTLVPACLRVLRAKRILSTSAKAEHALTEGFKGVVQRAGLGEGAFFMSKKRFKEKGFLGSGGIAQFRDVLWAAAFSVRSVAKLTPEKLAVMANDTRQKTIEALKT